MQFRYNEDYFEFSIQEFTKNSQATTGKLMCSIKQKLDRYSTPSAYLKKKKLCYIWCHFILHFVSPLFIIQQKKE